LKLVHAKCLSKAFHFRSRCTIASKCTAILFAATYIPAAEPSASAAQLLPSRRPGMPLTTHLLPGAVLQNALRCRFTSPYIFMAWRLHAANRYKQLPNPLSGSILKHFRIISGCADYSSRSVENANVSYRPAGTNKKQKHINPSSSCFFWGETGYRRPYGGYFYWLRAVRLKNRCWASGRRKNVVCATKCPDRQQDRRSLPFGGRRGLFPRGRDRPNREVDHSPSSTQFKNEWTYISTSTQYAFAVCTLLSHSCMSNTQMRVWFAIKYLSISNMLLAHA
jgi:hypothetical protein